MKRQPKTKGQTMSAILAHNGVLMMAAKAIETANSLNATEEEGWTYSVAEYPNGFAHVLIHDADGVYVGKL